MSPFLVLNIQATFSVVVFALIAIHYVYPRLSTLSIEEALLPLILVHTFRYAPLTLFVPGHVAADIPQQAASTIAYGDFISGIFALIAVILLMRKIRGAVLVTLIYNIFGILDIVNALRVAIDSSLYEFLPGFNWYIITFYVPILIVTHLMMFYLIWSKRSTTT